MEDLKNRIIEEVKSLAEGNNPDPSALTTALTQREISALKELVMGKISDIQSAIKLAHDDSVRVPTIIDKEIKTLRELHEEKFRGVTQRFADNKTALDAAFKNQQEVMTKSEAGTTKEIDAQKLALSNASTALQIQINDLKDRVLRGEGTSTGKNQSWVIVAGVIGLVIGFAGIVMAIISFLSKQTAP